MQTTHVSDPERLLKPKGYLKSTTASVGKIYQPKVAQVNTKVLVEELTPEENFKQAPSAETSTSKPEVRFEIPKEILPNIKTEIDSNDTPKGHNERSLSIPIVINIMSTSSFPEVKFSVLRNPEEHFLYPDSSPIGSPVYTSCKFEETSPRFCFPPLL
jgi:hypothetical protein